MIELKKEEGVRLFRMLMELVNYQRNHIDQLDEAVTNAMLFSEGEEDDISQLEYEVEMLRKQLTGLGVEIEFDKEEKSVDEN
jgi:hypothetical protein